MNEGMRVYSQLRPDENGIARLRAAQAELSATSTGRTMPVDELHMTVIHFGKADRIFESLSACTSVQRDSFDASLRYMVDAWGALMNEAFQLEHTGYDRFGKNGKTIVATFKPIPELQQLHDSQLSLLKTFLRVCSVNDVDSYISNDPNFVNALTLRPHVTLKKGHESRDLPIVELGTILFRPMQIVYKIIPIRSPV